MSPLTSILRYAVSKVARYQGLSPALSNFPILVKAQASADFAAHLSDDLGTDKPKLAEFLRDEDRRCGPNGETAFGSRIIIEETSGSSGLPFRTAKTLEERASLCYAIWKYRRKLDPLCSSKNFYPIYHRSAQTPALGKARDFTQGGVDNFYAGLTAAGIRWIHGGADILRRHAQLISGIIAKSKTVRFAENTSLSLSEDDWRFIEKNLDVALIDQYGCRETWAIGIRKDAGCFRILSENVVVELFDDTGNPITDPGKQGRIVVTSLHQKIFPIIRYDTGDLGSWADNLNVRELRLSNYRRHNLLRCHDSYVDGNEVFRKILGQVYKMTSYTHLQYIQIRQTAQDRFVLASSKSEKLPEICKVLTKICQSHMCFPKHVTFELRALSDFEIASEGINKPSLFTTKFNSSGSDVRTNESDS